MGKFLKSWLEREQHGKREEKKSKYTVKHDQYDQEDFYRLVEDMVKFAAYRNKLVASKAGELGYDATGDTYWSFWKARLEMLDHEEIDPTRVINEHVMKTMHEMSEFTETRRWTKGDEIAAAIAFTSIEPKLEELYEDLEKEIEQSKQLGEVLRGVQDAMDEQRSVDQIVKDWSDDQDKDGKQAQKDKSKQLGKDITQGIKDADKLEDEITKELSKHSGKIKRSLKEGLDEAGKKANALKEWEDLLWGTEKGQATRVDAEKRFELAERLNGDTFQQLAKLIGAMVRLAMTEQRRKVNFVPEQYHDIVIGNNLERMLLVEAANLADEDLADLFMVRYATKRLLQHEMNGTEHLSQGGIVYVQDSSGSMAGDREVWAKAVGLALLKIAAKQKRPFHWIHFASRGQIAYFDFSTKDKITDALVLECAELLLNGGTEFMEPLTLGLGILQKEFDSSGAIKGDIVFASDGECNVTDQWLTSFKEAQEELGFKVYGIAITMTGVPQVMKDICDQRVVPIGKLNSGEDIREIFRGI